MYAFLLIFHKVV